MADIDGKCDPSPIHSFDTCGVNAFSVMRLTYIFSVDNSDSLQSFSSHEMEVYEDTQLSWLFHIALSQNDKKILSTFRHSVDRRMCAGCPFLQTSEGHRFYLATSGLKKVAELGIRDGDTFQLGHEYDDQSQRNDAAPSKKKGRKVVEATKTRRNNGNKRANGKRKSKRKKALSHRPSQDLSQGKLREMHSKKMNSVLDEMSPKLKAIREKLSALSLQKTMPKRGNAIPLGERNENIRNNALPGQFSKGKAGRKVYQVVVGDPNNLYKTHQSA